MRVGEEARTGSVLAGDRTAALHTMVHHRLAAAAGRTEYHTPGQAAEEQKKMSDPPTHSRWTEARHEPDHSAKASGPVCPLGYGTTGWAVEGSLDKPDAGRADRADSSSRHARDSMDTVDVSRTVAHDSSPEFLEEAARDIPGMQIGAERGRRLRREAEELVKMATDGGNRTIFHG